MVDMSEVSLCIEVRQIYDGVSVYKMQDGRLVNRWPEDDRRHKATQEWIEMMVAAEGDNHA